MHLRKIRTLILVVVFAFALIATGSCVKELASYKHKTAEPAKTTVANSNSTEDSFSWILSEEEIRNRLEVKHRMQVSIPVLIAEEEEIYEPHVTKLAAKETISEEVVTPVKAEDIVPGSETTRSYTDAELEMLARLISAEATVWYDESAGCWKECSNEWQCYVGCVVLNRMESPYYPDTMKEVIFQEGQYACTWDGGYYNEPVPRAYKNARRVLEGYRPVPRDVIGQAGFYYGEVWLAIGNTYFFYGP